MKMKTTKLCPHCKKPIDLRSIEVDKASQDEMTEFFKSIIRSD